jgi:predicted RNA-binding protein with EMAP domain
MWDTSKDYRLLVAEKSVELFLKTIDGANLKGKWNKKKVLQAAGKMKSEIHPIKTYTRRLNWRNHNDF